MKVIVFTLVAAVVFIIFAKSSFDFIKPDKQCVPRATPSVPPVFLETANDFFEVGNYNYDKGDCKEAVLAYTKALELDPNFAQAYNNRAYTYMRMRNYAKALPNLDDAIRLRPDYVNALMNRGDIYNFYYAIDRKKALADYNQVLQLGIPEGSSLCGHRMLAMNNGWSLNILWQMLTKGINAGCI